MAKKGVQLQIEINNEDDWQALMKKQGLVGG